MRVDEIDGSNAAERRIKRLKTQADRAADVHDMQKSRQKLAKLQRDAATSNIKPYH